MSSVIDTLANLAPDGGRKRIRGRGATNQEWDAVEQARERGVRWKTIYEHFTDRYTNLKSFVSSYHHWRKTIRYWL